jgi:uncharacterized protein
MTTTEIDRLAMRAKPEGTPMMHQNWDNLLFMHWPIDPAAIRPLIPDELEIDTYEGQAWIGVTPFAMNGVRLEGLPAIPGLESLLELNVRTYVHYKGMPGIWFFSLDASKVIPAVAARILFMLPYYKATMHFADNGTEFQFESARLMPLNARFKVHWQTGVRLREPHLESLAFFLVERYAFFTVASGNVNMVRVYHHPWILDEATVLSYESIMIGALGLSEPTFPPLAHFSRSLHVEVWQPNRV